MRSEHKNTKHCYEKDGTRPIIYILAFFQVVASGQISPHFFSAAKVDKIL